MAFGEVFSALETGTIDAVEINLSSAFAESYYEAAKSATLTGHYFWPGVLMMGSARFDGLTDDQKKAFKDKTMPEVTKIIVQKFGAEGQEMLKAFLEAIAAAEK